MRTDFGVKSWFYPLPVLIIGTWNPDGTTDAMNAAWGGLYDADKVVLCLSEDHRTTRNIRTNGAFTVSFADAEHVTAADYVGLVSGNSEPHKMEKAHFHPIKSAHVNAPLIQEMTVALARFGITLTMSEFLSMPSARRATPEPSTKSAVVVFLSTPSARRATANVTVK